MGKKQVTSVLLCRWVTCELVLKTVSGSEGFKQESDGNRFGFGDGG